MAGLDEIRLVILDIDGVIYCKNGAVPGASAAIATLREYGLMVKFLTNDAISSRLARAQELNALGFDVHSSEVYTAGSLTADYLRLMGNPRTMLLLEGECVKEFLGVPIVEDDPQVVVVGDYFGSYSFEKLNHAFLAIRKGASFIAMQRNRFCSMGGDPTIDVGFWVAGLEHCTGIQAEVVGKPSVKSYLIICQEVGVTVDHAVMVSDDLSSDLLGAREAGLITVHATDYCVPSSSKTLIEPDFAVPNLSHFVKMVCH